MRYYLLILAVIAQAITIAITWPLWCIRSMPVHLPICDLPQIPFGEWLLVTLLIVLIWPRWGLIVHATSLAVAMAFDQWRMQPQFIALVVLMYSVIADNGPIVARWFLASLWCWAGLHKLLSPEWHGEITYYMVAMCRLDPVYFQKPFAVGVGLSELAVGLFAIIRPGWAAAPALAMHWGIALFLSPLFYDHNASVIPWNLATGIIGLWVMRQAAHQVRMSKTQWVYAATMLIYPLGFYGGIVDHGISHVLYSGQLPHGLITEKDTVTDIRGFGIMAVPFPEERRLLAEYFRRSAKPGDLLHIDDVRPLGDLYYQLAPDGSLKPLDRQTFLDRHGEEYRRH